MTNLRDLSKELHLIFRGYGCLVRADLRLVERFRPRDSNINVFGAIVSTKVVRDFAGTSND